MRRLWSAFAVLLFASCFTFAQIEPGGWHSENDLRFKDTGEDQCFLSQNVSKENGALVLTAKHEDWTSSNNVCGPGTLHYTSGSVRWASYSYLYGVAKARIKFPTATGSWGNFFLISSACPQSSILTTAGAPYWFCQANYTEIDAAEARTSQRGTTQVNQSMYVNATGHWFSAQATVGDISQWHEYMIRWWPGNVIISADGTVNNAITNEVPSTPLFVGLTLELEEPLNPLLFPERMEVDYVRVCTDANPVTAAQIASTSNCNPGDAEMKWESEFHNLAMFLSNVELHGMKVNVP